MSQTNTNTGGGNTNRNQHAGSSRRGQGGSGGQGNGGCGCNCKNSTIDVSSFEGKLKEGYLHKLTITELTHRATQYKKTNDALLVLCADKGFQFVDNVICTNSELVEMAFLLPYPNKVLLFNVKHV